METRLQEISSARNTGLKVKMSGKVVICANEGQIRGTKRISKFSRTEYYSFFGIPYGKPPIGSLRFKDPVKAKPWKGILDATSEKEGCIQFSFQEYRILGSEDCLYHDIHIPKLPKKCEALRPVIVNIPTGAFHFGSPHTQCYGSPEFIMHNDVVYVNVSYRLHILGFLNLGLKECSGNQAIKDIILCLRWIKNNIGSFGGDPDNVTLLGSSSGATLIHFLILSSSARDLFHKAVCMSGECTNPCLPFQESNEVHAREMAKNLGYSGNLHDHTKLLSFLKKQEPTLMIAQSRRLQKDVQETIAPIFPISVFSPSLDREDILPESPRKLVKSIARIPILAGATQVESAMGFVKGVRGQTEKNFKYSLRQNCFGWGYHLSDADIHSIYEEVEQVYLNGQPIDNAPLSIKMDIQNDICLSDTYDTFINPIAKDLLSSVFVYKFEFMGNMFSMNKYLNTISNEQINRTVHGSDFAYWNHMGDPKDKVTREMVETFTKLITTFAKTGDPNYENFPIKWRSSTPDNPCYLSMNDPFVMVDDKLNHDRAEFWDNIKKKYATD